ncbi:MAG: class I SAM-dependent methyltransferase [Candidatus Omnitrophota bacterium]
MSITQKIRAKIIVACYKNWGICGKKVLDVGCGNGVVSKILEEKFGLNLCGTDIIDYRKVNIPFRKMDRIDKLPFDDLSFDYVIFNDVLHHSKDVVSLIVEGKRIAKCLLIFEDKPSFLLYITDIIFNFFYSYKMPLPVNFKTREEWYVLFEELGFNCESGKLIYPVWYPFKHMVFRLTGKKKIEKK